MTETTTAQKAPQTITVTPPAPATAVYNTTFTVDVKGGGSLQQVMGRRPELARWVATRSR